MELSPFILLGMLENDTNWSKIWQWAGFKVYWLLKSVKYSNKKECTSFCNKTISGHLLQTDTYIQCYYKSLDKAELLKMMLCISTMNNFTPNDKTNFWLHRLFFFFWKLYLMSTNSSTLFATQIFANFFVSYCLLASIGMMGTTEGSGI